MTVETRRGARCEAAIPVLSADYAHVFGSPKSHLVECDDGGCSVTQTGAAYLDNVGRPLQWPAVPVPDETVIETFVADGKAQITPTSTNQPYVDAWLPLVETVSSRVLDAAHRFGIPIASPIYVTVSLTVAGLVSGDPHLDDDQYHAQDGVGLVAIVGQHVGPRIALGRLPHQSLRSPGQVQIGGEVVSSFSTGEIAHQRGEPDRIVLFPQFGQLHAGPGPAVASTAATRNLLVLRAATTPR